MEQKGERKTGKTQRTSHKSLYDQLLKDPTVLTNQEFFALKKKLEQLGGDK